MLIIFDFSSKESKVKKNELLQNMFPIYYIKKVFNLFIYVICFSFLLVFNFKKISFDSDALNLKDDNLKSVILANNY